MIHKKIISTLIGLGIVGSLTACGGLNGSEPDVIPVLHESSGIDSTRDNIEDNRFDVEDEAPEDSENAAGEGDSSDKDEGGALGSGGEKVDDKDSFTENTENTEESVQQEETLVRKITVTATGDCSLGALQTHGYDGSFHAYYDAYGEGYFMENFEELFQSDDFTLVNLECTLTNRSYNPEDNPEKEFYIVGRPEYAGILSNSGVEGCSLGNNHTRDVGAGGLEDTMNTCDEHGLLWAYNDVTATYVTEDGYKIGFVSSNLSGLAERENYMRNGIAELRESDVDLVIACCHWGIERENYPTDYQRMLAHEFIELGADLIIGNHPHVVQGVEYYQGKVICYSLGNFSFGANRNPGDKGTVVFQQTFTFVDGKLQPELSARIIPARVTSVTAYNNFQPTPTEGEEREEMLNRMRQYSEPYSSVQFDEEGNILIGE